jgi:hypothetical protein
VIDVLSVKGREVFSVEASDDASVRVVDASVELRHLLVHATSPGQKEPFKFLCGHDERHWFVAGVPNDRGVANVQTAIEALKPQAVREAQTVARVKHRDGRKRRNRAFLRQGEWFFVPEATLKVESWQVRRHEPIRRSARGKPHWAEYAYRTGGESVMVSTMAQTGISMEQYRRLLESDERARKTRWTLMRRNPLLYVRGRVSHADHATLVLDGWHRVFMNEERRAPSSAAVAFLD